jgi:tripartite-type tricarboxylate transporter receptor subunit TctC
MKFLINFSSLIFVIVFSLATVVMAQDFPNKPVRIIVPASPGGNIDVTARVLAPGMSEFLKQPVVVENRIGGGGMIGIDYVAKSAPDGYTIVMGSSSTFTVGPNVYKNWPIDPVKGLTPIMYVHFVPFALVVNAQSPDKSVHDLIKRAKDKPGTVSQANGGTGTSNHLVSELFQMLTDTKFILVPYQGGGPAMTSVISAQTESYFDQASTSVSPAQSGRVRVLGLTSKTRWAPMPDVPTFNELGIKDFEVNGVTGLAGPAGLPRAIVMRINEAVAYALSDLKVKDRMNTMGAVIVGSSPEDFDRFIREDLIRWSKVVKATGASAQ